MAPVPVTLLTGFLGAGKTTLLNQVLRDPGGRRIAVLVNDFGDIPVDGLLVESVDEDTITFAGGCMCCQVKDDVPQAVYRLLNRPDRPDHIVVEASGIANPFDAAKPLADLAPVVEVDGVVGVVDAEHLSALEHPDGSINWTDLAIDHVMAADIVVLNKVDLVAGDRLEVARALVRKAVGRARVIEAVQADVPVELVLGVGGSAIEDDGHDHEHGHPDYESWSFSSDEPLSLEAFRGAVRELPTSVIRGKGIVYAADRPERVVFQLVGTRTTIEPGGAWVAEPRTELVLIGPKGGLDIAELERLLASTAPEAPVAEDIAGFYDSLSGDYHLASDGWNESVDRFGVVFDGLLIELFGRPGPFDVLDCSCGIGQQAIGIAGRGHRVHGSDLSGASLARAERDARALGLELTTSVADMRRLDVEVGGEWDVVMSAGNSLAHLDVAGVREVARAALAVLRPGGFFLAHLRDYEELVEVRPRIPPGQYVHDMPDGKKILFQVWDWAPTGDGYTLNFFVVDERDGAFEVRCERAFLHAHRPASIVAALEDVGLTDVSRREAYNARGAGVVVAGRKPTP